MIEAKGIVISSQGGQVTISWQSESSCGSCSQKSDCGSGLVAQAFNSNSNILTLPSEQQYSAGTILRLGISEPTLLSAAAWVYLLPLFFAITSALLVHLQWQTELMTIICAFIGGGIGFLIARAGAKRIPDKIEILGQLGQPLSN